MSSIIGIVIALVAIGVGMILKGTPLSSMNNPAAFLIIIGGTISTILIAFPFSEFKKVPKLLKIALFDPKLPSSIDRIKDLVHCAEIAKKEGILALEEHSTEVNDPFFKNGLELVIDGNNPEFIEDVLLDEVDALQKRHNVGSLIFTQAGTYAPTLGVLGAVVGLVAALGNLNDVDVLGHSVSAAFVATLLGIFLGYVICHPIANKLKRLSKQEQELKLLTIEGLLAIYKGVTPSNLEKKLAAYLSPQERRKLESKPEENVNEKIA